MMGYGGTAIIAVELEADPVNADPTDEMLWSSSLSEFFATQLRI